MNSLIGNTPLIKIKYEYNSKIEEIYNKELKPSECIQGLYALLRTKKYYIFRPKSLYTATALPK